MKLIARIVAPLIASISASALVFPAMAHEFWISPQSYQVETGDTILADLRVGQNFSGSAFPFVQRSIEVFDIVTPSDRLPVPGRMGDRPAAQVPATEDGLHVLVHETTNSIVHYTGMEKFEAFLTHKDQLWVLNQHAANGFSAEKFSESYRRYGKSLIAVGDGAGADTRVGLNWELVALTNPYTDDLSGGFSAQLWRDDAPVADTQIELFARDSADEVTVTQYRTNQEGVVTLPMNPATEYLVDAVELVLAGPDSPGEAVWHSNWASLTFKTPN